VPNIVLPIEDIQDSVDRPVIYDIIRQVMDITKISSKTQIMFLGDEGKTAQKNSEIIKDLITENRWNYNEKIIIEVDEDYDRNRIINSYVQQPETNFIFRDADLPVYIKPIYSSSEVKITIKYRTRDKNQANSWRNDIRTKTAMMRDLNLHEITYHYHLQEEFILILKEIHRLRENVGGYNESWDDYFINRLTSKASIITNLSGDQAIWAIAEKQIRVQGYFDFEGTPDKGDKDGDHDNWGISVTYNFTYQKPIECNMIYPIVIHNQLLSDHWRHTENIYKIENHIRSFTKSGRAFAEFESDMSILNYKGNDGISIPSFDEFIPHSILPTTVRILTALATISEIDKKNLFNLNDLGELSLDPIILDFLSKEEYPFLGRDFQSIFSLNLYRNGYMTSTGTISVDTNLNIFSKSDLSLREQYRVRLGLVTDLSYLPLAALRRLRKYPLVVQKLIPAFNSALSDMGSHPDINKNQLTPADIAILTGYADGSELINKNTATYTNSLQYPDASKLPVTTTYGSTNNMGRGEHIGINSTHINLVYTNDTFGRSEKMSLVQSLFIIANRSN